MELVTGQVVWVAFATASDRGGAPYASVSRGVVLDGEHRVIKRDHGYVGVCHSWSVEQCHATEASAWSANADLLERSLDELRAKITECRLAASKAAIMAEAAA